jgi:hypothetical protein
MDRRRITAQTSALNQFGLESQLLRRILEAIFEYNNLAQSLTEGLCKEVVKENKWPEDTKCELSNPNDLTSPLVFKVPEKKADTKPEPKK